MARATLRLPDDLHALIRQKSLDRGISLNQFIVETLKATLGRLTTSVDEPESVQSRVQKLRTILGDLVEPNDPLTFIGQLPANASSLTEREAFRNSLPILDPPFSATIIEEREDRY